MKTLEYNSMNLIKDGKAWLPMGGEMQYSKTRCEEWHDSLLKMKAGGLDVVMSYVFWIHHEENENEWNFEGNCSLKNFLSEVKNCGLSMVLRIGPWVHGECRNGGFPDWLIEKCGDKVRTNDSKYLKEVEIFYKKIYEQCKGFMFSDGGPVIAIQIENELGPCGGANGQEGNRHICLLHKMLEDIGFNVPIYIATGWGNAKTGDALPVWGAYLEEPWERRVEDIDVDEHRFNYSRNDNKIATDFGAVKNPKASIEGFPFFTVELGAGIQISNYRRPVITAKDAGALALCKLGSGCNALGFYIYHGGSNPVGKNGFMNETVTEDSRSYIPEISYDFQAPVGEYGQIRDSFKELKLIGMMIRDFGEDLAPLETDIPESTGKLRYAFRHDDSHGYLFINNHARRTYMSDRPVDIKLELKDTTVEFPEMIVRKNDYCILPFNMKIGKSLLKTANATPLCTLNGTSFVFWTDFIPEYNFAGERDKSTEIITLSRKDALNAYKIKLDKEYIFVSDSLVVKDGESLEIWGNTKPCFKVYPELKAEPQGFTKTGTENGFTVYEKNINTVENKVSFLRTAEGEYKINIEYGASDTDAFIHINYGGNMARLYMGDKFIADNFYTGLTWDIGLKRFGYPTELTLVIDDLSPSTEATFGMKPPFIEKWPPMVNGKANDIYDISINTQYKNRIF